MTILLSLAAPNARFQLDSTTLPRYRVCNNILPTSPHAHESSAKNKYRKTRRVSHYKVTFRTYIVRVFNGVYFMHVLLVRGKWNLDWHRLFSLSSVHTTCIYICITWCSIRKPFKIRLGCYAAVVRDKYRCRLAIACGCPDRSDPRPLMVIAFSVLKYDRIVKKLIE